MNATRFPKMLNTTNGLYRLVDDLSDATEVNYATYESGSRRVYYCGKASIHAVKVTISENGDSVCVPGQVIGRVLS